MRLLTKINEAAKNWERTKDPKYKKEWYRLVNLFAKLIRKKPSQKAKNK